MFNGKPQSFVFVVEASSYDCNHFLGFCLPSQMEESTYEAEEIFQTSAVVPSYLMMRMMAGKGDHNFVRKTVCACQ
jgi:hypothetical protein